MTAELTKGNTMPNSPTNSEQLRSMLGLQQGSLLDQQMREQQIQQQASGGGLFSGAVGATLRGNDAIGNSFRGRQVGVNEKIAEQENQIRQQEAAVVRERTALENGIVTTDDVTKLEKIRDALVQRGTPEAAASAKLAQAKIEKLKQKSKKSTGAGKLITASGLPQAVQDTLNEEVSSGVTTPENIPARIKAMNLKVSDQLERSSAETLINSYGLTEKDATKFKTMLKSGVPVTDVISKIEPKTDELTLQNLITMYRFYTPESVDEYKAAVAAGKKVADMPRLVSLAKANDGKIVTTKPTAFQAATLKSAIEVLGDVNPEVQEFFEKESWFTSGVDTKKVLAATAQIYALANARHISIDDAVVEYMKTRGGGLTAEQEARLAELENKSTGGA